MSLFAPCGHPRQQDAEDDAETERGGPIYCALAVGEQIPEQGYDGCYGEGQYPRKKKFNKYATNSLHLIFLSSMMIQVSMFDWLWGYSLYKDEVDSPLSHKSVNVHRN